MSNDMIIPELNYETIESMIYEIRGKRVMLDFDLAKIYGYETKYFNRQVNNNIDRFEKEFRFQISKEELNSVLRCKNFTANTISKSRKLPYAFNEQGIYTLKELLKGG